MSFVIRAAMVIGALSWFALQRQGAEVSTSGTELPLLADAARSAWETLPEGAREAALREGGAQIARRAGAVAAARPVSHDTLVEADRSQPWRGAPARPDPK